ncbi:MAG: hypothetical protein GF353_09615 [Candidatus Lokiarchaeota archaeon]|nr:hypothetical protein [Candidatus Lokiarchaeota archaeon]
MYKIEKIGENVFYCKGLGNFPPSVAKRFSEEFLGIIEELENYSVIIDTLSMDFLKLDSLEILLDLLEKSKSRLVRSAFIISNNPPLSKEIKYLLENSYTLKRKIVENYDDAKKWVEIDEIIIQRD